MATTNINVRTDSVLKEKAQTVLAGLGLDMSTAINVYLHQIVNQNGIPFAVANPASKKITLGKYKNQIWVSDDFDAPLEAFREYTE